MWEKEYFTEGVQDATRESIADRFKDRFISNRTFSSTESYEYLNSIFFKKKGEDEYDDVQYGLASIYDEFNNEGRFPYMDSTVNLRGLIDSDEKLYLGGRALDIELRKRDVIQQRDTFLEGEKDKGFEGMRNLLSTLDPTM